MGVTSVSAGESIAKMAQQLFNACDSNRDGQLTAVEFQDLLQSLVTKQPLVNRSSAETSVAPRAVAAAPPAMEGFDPAKIPGRQSPKYMFARVAMQQNLSGVNDKAGAEALLEQMRPALKAEGLDVLDIENDRIKIAHEGKEQWIDVIRAAGTADQAFQWMMI